MFKSKERLKGEIQEPIEATISRSVPTNYYVAKGGNVEITYTIEDNTDEDVKQIRINGVALTVAKVEDGIYKVTMKAPTENIPQNRKIALEATEIIYESDSIEVVHSTEIEILKDMPEVTNDYIHFVENKPILHFEIKDEDDTFVSGRIIITHEDGTEAEKTFEKEEQVIEIELEGLEEFATYNIQIEIKYDLDTNKNDEANKGTWLSEKHELLMQTDYDLSVTDFKLVSVTPP